MFIIFVLLFSLGNCEICPSPIYKIEPEECTSNNIGSLGMLTTLKYGKLLFKDNSIILDKKQLNCVLNSNFKLSININNCINDITINNNTFPEKVARGLALNNNGQWVSACAQNMPCREFNNFAYNNSLEKLLKYCNAIDKFNIVLNTTDLIISSLFGYEYCQKTHPVKCMYKEPETCSNDKIYACPVSRWIYASNFILLYMLNPSIAMNMPNCRII